MNIFKGVGEEKGVRVRVKKLLGFFPVLILALVKMVLETRDVKAKRMSICQSACFRSVTLDSSVLT